jgi:hypothetical protein
MLIAASQRKTEAKNGIAGDILPMNDQNGFGNR